MKVLIAISGASGSIYAKTLLSELALLRAAGTQLQVAVVASSTACGIWEEELSEGQKEESHKQPAALANFVKECGFELLDNFDFHTAYASGSNCADAMIILPASMGCVGRIASGISIDLISRAADVMLKERKTLIIVPRESPLSLIHLQNLTLLSQASAQIMPACPTFYNHPHTIEDLVENFIMRLLDRLELPTRSVSYKYMLD